MLSCSLQQVQISEPSKFPLGTLVSSSSLDMAQAQAMKAMLTQELAVVQGPPGTGGNFNLLLQQCGVLDQERGGQG
jgi:hypothetical protein